MEKTNKYRASKMGGKLHIISLCEIAKLPIGENVKANYSVRNKDGSVSIQSASGILKSHH